MIHSLTGAVSRDGSYESHFNDSFTDGGSVTTGSCESHFNDSFTDGWQRHDR